MTATATTDVEAGLLLDGLRCSGCAGRVERALREIDGVHDVSINYTTLRALIRHDPSVTPEALASGVTDLGYGAVPYDPTSLDRPATVHARHALVRLLVAGFLAGNVMVVAAALYLGEYQGMDLGVRRGLRWLAIALSLPAATWCAGPFWLGALSGLRRRELTIDVPIVLGVSTAFVVSILGTLAETRHVFMDSAAMIVFLILLGRTLERAARARASGAVERLLAHAPRTALRRGPHGPERVDVEELRVGDSVTVAPGDAVPIDGRIVSGTTELDCSLLTGEATPVHRGPGDAIAGGTQNLLCEIEVEVSALAARGTLARLAALLERATAQRPQIQMLADRVAAVFAPVVLAAAALVAGIWLARGAPALDVAMAAAAVLIVACPCALALATPAAVTTAIGRAAQLGVLVKSGEALERCAAVDAAVLDKTGTVTEGRLKLVGVCVGPGENERDVLALAAAAEGASPHPIAEALQREVHARDLVCPDLEERRTLPGLGIEAGDVRVGSRALLDAAGVYVEPALADAAERLAETGATLAWVAREKSALGVIGLADLPRPDARQAVARLAGLGVEVSLVTGDHARAAERAAQRAGIDRIAFEASPEDKVAFVTRERSLGRHVLVGGDGINDAAAMAGADVGAAFACGADVAIQAADFVVHAPRLDALPAMIELSRLTLRRIRQNLGFAVAYNAIAVPLAAVGILEPLHAAIAMSLSSLVVTANALRLHRFEPGAASAR